MKSTLFVLVLCVGPVAACSVDKGGLANVDGLGGAAGAGSGGRGGSGGTLAATGGHATGGATASDASGTPSDSGTADGPAGERPVATGGAGAADARVDLRPTGGAGGSGGIVGVDGGSGGVMGNDGGDDGRAPDARSDVGPGPDLARDTADAEPRDLAREGAPDRTPDLPPGADGPTSDAPDPTDLADATPDTPAGPETNGEANPLALVWNDEFDGAASTGVDTGKWTYVSWPPGTVNDELQQYTSNIKNVFQDGQGRLVIRALHSGPGQGSYTSGRIETTGKISFGPGHRIEVRAKLPAGKGSFPAILLMGTTGSWPDSGSLALMEQYGQDKSWIYATAYAPDTPGSGVTPRTKYTFEDATTASADFHVYALDWYADHVVFQVDGEVVLTSNYGPSSPFYSITEYLVLDVAVGGNMGGDVDNAAFPMDMVVDYVRVYQF